MKKTILFKKLTAKYLKIENLNFIILAQLYKYPIEKYLKV